MIIDGSTKTIATHMCGPVFSSLLACVDHKLRAIKPRLWSVSQIFKETTRNRCLKLQLLRAVIAQFG